MRRHGVSRLTSKGLALIDRQVVEISDNFDHDMLLQPLASEFVDEGDDVRTEESHKIDETENAIHHHGALLLTLVRTLRSGLAPPKMIKRQKLSPLFGPIKWPSG